MISSPAPCTSNATSARPSRWTRPATCCGPAVAGAIELLCRGVKSPRFRSRSTGSSLHRSSIHCTSPAGRASIASRTPIESGLRRGELTELRLRDLHLTNGIVTVSRGVCEPKHADSLRAQVASAPPPRHQALAELGVDGLGDPPPLHGSGMRLIAASYSPCSDRQRHTADTSRLCIFSEMECP